MARHTDKTGKTEAGQLPAEIYKFPQSGSASYKDAEQGAQPPNLSSAEQRLYDELLVLARRLDKRGVSGVYGLVATIADQVTSLKNQGQSTVAALARGLDTLKKLDESRTGARLQTKREVMSDHDISISCAVLSVLVSIWMMLGFGGTGEDFRYGVFWLAVAAACMVPTLWDLRTKR